MSTSATFTGHPTPTTSSCATRPSLSKSAWPPSTSEVRTVPPHRASRTSSRELPAVDPLWLQCPKNRFAAHLWAMFEALLRSGADTNIFYLAIHDDTLDAPTPASAPTFTVALTTVCSCFNSGLTSSNEPRRRNKLMDEFRTPILFDHSVTPKDLATGHPRGPHAEPMPSNATVPRCMLYLFISPLLTHPHPGC